MESSKERNIEGKIFQIVKQIGAGSCGHVELAKNIINGLDVILKHENFWIEIVTPKSVLFREKKMYDKLHNGPMIDENYFLGSPMPEIRIPKVYSLMHDGDHYILEMELLGDDLGKLFKLCNKKFSLKTVLMLADQMLTIIQWIHSKGIVHRDLQPSNFAMGLSENSKYVYLMDFGIAKKYVKGKDHVKFDDGADFCGNRRFASRSALCGFRQTRRDDLESLGYILVYFLKGTLPWLYLEDPKYWEAKKDAKEVFEREWFDAKYDLLIEDLCEGLPEQFQTFFHYCQELHFKDTPDYNYLRSLFSDIFQKSQFTFDYEYDFLTLNKEKD